MEEADLHDALPMEVGYSLKQFIYQAAESYYGNRGSAHKVIMGIRSK